MRDPHDRRRHLVRITPEGLKGLQAAERAQAAIEDEVLNALDEAERNTLRELLARALRGVEPADGDACDTATASIST